MRAIFALILAAASLGCQTPGKWNESSGQKVSLIEHKMRSWNGYSSADLMQLAGPPSKTNKLSNGSKLLTYFSNETVVSRSSAHAAGNNFLPGAPQAFGSGQSVAQRTQCRYSFTVSPADKIVYTSWQGCNADMVPMPPRGLVPLGKSRD